MPICQVPPVESPEALPCPTLHVSMLHCMESEDCPGVLFINIYSVIAGQTMVWAIFHLLPINMKFQWAVLSKFNIAISVVNGQFFC